MLRLAILSLWLLAANLAAQPFPGHFLVLCDTGGSAPRARLFDVDPVNGKIIDCGRFPGDLLRPLALAVDPINGQVLIASAESGGGSGLRRFHLSASGATGSRLVLTTTAQIHSISIRQGGDLILGLHPKTPDAGQIDEAGRNAGGATALLGCGFIDALSAEPMATHATLIEQSNVGPMLSLIDLSDGSRSAGPIHVPPLAVGTGNGFHTDVYDMPTAVPRQVMSHGFGGLMLLENFSVRRPVGLLPVGSTLRILGEGDRVVALGDSRSPNLIRVQILGEQAGAATHLAGPIPDSPVDLALIPSPKPELLRFGEPCSGGSIAWSGEPRLGNLNFYLELQGAAPNVTAGLVLGLSDQRTGSTPLPQTLPGLSCPLLVSTDLLMVTSTSSYGHAAFQIPLPKLPALYGLRLYGQWISHPSLLRSSDAIAAYLSW